MAPSLPTLPPPYHSLPNLLFLPHRQARLPIRRLLAAHALAAVAGHLSLPNPHAHTLLLIAYSRLHCARRPSTLLLFRSSLRLSLPPTRHTLPLAISVAASSRPHLPLALSLHAIVVARSLLPFPHVANALVSLYAKNALPDSARMVFDEMHAPDVISYNALMDGYIKAGLLGLAMKEFQRMPQRDAASWGTVLAGCAKAGRWKEAVRLFDRMRAEGFRPDDVALAAALSCCAQLGALEKGREVHEYVRQSRPRPNVFLCTGLVDLYAKCGRVDVALEVFDSCPARNVFTWNALIVGLAMHGHGTVALEYFNRMLLQGVRPDGVTLLGVLIGCSHAGLVDMAKRIFSEMEGEHGVPRELKHYGCMADLLGRAGLIEEAIEMVKKMPTEGDTYVWGGILTGCRMHGNVEAAEVAARHLLELNPQDSGVYSVLAGIYADAARWEDVARVRKLMDERIARRNVGCSSITADH
ncbi:pentatricopeptide repeat-containing protein At5g61800-like [Lolium perenne]|uniref:pentatricopeptide repeat-containing protein At5g61800-like n=1 Tax=Lolium perenne TaxID=4522 RepID=UPI003A9A094A